MLLLSSPDFGVTTYGYGAFAAGYGGTGGVLTYSASSSFSLTGSYSSGSIWMS